MIPCFSIEGGAEPESLFSVAEPLNQTEQSDEDYQKDKQEMDGFLGTCKWLAVHHFTSIPFTVVVTLLTDKSDNFHWYFWGLWLAGMIAKIAWGTYTGVGLMRKIQAFAMKHRMVSTTKFLNGTSNDGMLSAMVPDWFSKALFGAPLYVDVDLDMATAMNAIMLSSATSREHWVVSWEKVPLIGKYIAIIGLPFTMTILTIIASCMQIYFTRQALLDAQRRVEEWPKASDRSPKAWKKRFLTWQSMGALSDVSSNVLMGEVCQNVCIDYSPAWEDAEKTGPEGNPNASHPPPGRGAKFEAKIVYEAAPQMWLQVSFVAQSFSSTHWRTILTGIGAVITGLITMFGEILRNVKRMRSLWSKMKNKVFEVVRMCVVIFIAVACLVRTLGIWYCEDHVLNLSSGCVSMED